MSLSQAKQLIEESINTLGDPKSAFADFNIEQHIDMKVFAKSKVNFINIQCAALNIRITINLEKAINLIEEAEKSQIPTSDQLKYKQMLHHCKIAYIKDAIERYGTQTEASKKTGLSRIQMSTLLNANV